MGKSSTILLITAAAALFSGTAAAGNLSIYKWVDGQGVVHYSDHAPAPGRNQTNLTLMTLPALPAPGAQVIAADQAWIASINKWYQTVVQQQQQEEYLQLLATKQAEPPPPPPAPVESVSYVAPCWSCGFGFRLHHHRHFRRPLLSLPTPQSFQASLWNTRPNPFSQQLYKP
jgi:hypothetical protein